MHTKAGYSSISSITSPSLSCLSPFVSRWHLQPLPHTITIVSQSCPPCCPRAYSFWQLRKTTDALLKFFRECIVEKEKEWYSKISLFLNKVWPLCGGNVAFFSGIQLSATFQNCYSFILRFQNFAKHFFLLFTFGNLLPWAFVLKKENNKTGFTWLSKEGFTVLNWKPFHMNVKYLISVSLSAKKRSSVNGMAQTTNVKHKIRNVKSIPFHAQPQRAMSQPQ